MTCRSGPASWSSVVGSRAPTSCTTWHGRVDRHPAGRERRGHVGVDVARGRADHPTGVELHAGRQGRAARPARQRAAHLPGHRRRAGVLRLRSRAAAWFEPVRDECRAVRERVGVLALNAFAAFEVAGADAAAVLDRLTTNRPPNVGGRPGQRRRVRLHDQSGDAFAWVDPAPAPAGRADPGRPPPGADAGGAGP